MGLSSFFKNLFGSTKESVTELAENAESTFEHAVEAAAPYIEKAEAFAEETIEKVKDVAEPIIEQAKETITEYAEKASDSIDEAIDTLKEKSAAFNAEPVENIVTETVVDTSEKAVTDPD